jgi:Skp family chaperone for outer membrane proteins
MESAAAGLLAPEGHMPRKLALAVLLLVVQVPVSSAAPCAGFIDVDDSSAFCTNAAIHGLDAKLEASLAERDAEIAQLRREMADLAARWRRGHERTRSPAPRVVEFAFHGADHLEYLFHA